YRRQPESAPERGAGRDPPALRRHAPLGCMARGRAVALALLHDRGVDQHLARARSGAARSGWAGACAARLRRRAGPRERLTVTGRSRTNARPVKSLSSFLKATVALASYSLSHCRGGPAPTRRVHERASACPRDPTLGRPPLLPPQPRQPVAALGFRVELPH